MITPITQQARALVLLHVAAAAEIYPPASCAVIPQANAVSGTPGLPGGGSHGPVKFLGKLETCEECEAACTRNSTKAAPCHSWAFYYPDSAQKEYAGSCYGRHDEVWHPQSNIPIKHNHCCSGKSCLYPPTHVMPPPSPGPHPEPPPGPPPPPNGPATPAFSWDTVPVYNFPCFDPTHGPGGGPFNSTDISLLIKFPLVLLCHGYYDSAGTLVKAELAMANVAMQLKQRAPGIKVLFYKNSILDWNDYEFHDKLLLRPDLWARQKDGNATLTHGDGEFVQPKAGMLSVDFTQQAGRDFWMAECLNATKTPYFDGCFADRAGSFPSNLDPAKKAAFGVGHNDVMLSTQTGIEKLKQGGLLVSNNDYIEGVKSTMLEGFKPSNGSITQLIEGARLNIAVLAHGGYGEDCADMGSGSLPAFLIGAGEGSFYGCSHAWTFRTGWNEFYPEFSKPLGAPHGNASYDVATSTWSRVFGAGVLVTFDVSSKKGAIDWGQ